MSDHESSGSGLTEAQNAKIVHDWKNQEPRRLLRSITEEVICEYAGVPYDPVNQSHNPVMQNRWAAVVRMQGEQAAADAQAAQAREDRLQRRKAITNGFLEKLTTILTGVAVTVGLGWLATKLGFKLPGAP